MLKKGGAITLKKFLATLMPPLPSEMKSAYADAKVAKLLQLIMHLIQVCSFTEGAAVLVKLTGMPTKCLSQASEELTPDVVTLAKVIGYEDNFFFNHDYIILLAHPSVGRLNGREDWQRSLHTTCPAASISA